MSNESRWFLAHSRATTVPEIEQMCAVLPARLSGGGWDATVIPGRDDFAARAAACGGWKRWTQDVAVAESWDGSALFHGCVEPITGSSRWVGRATADIVQGCLDAHKHAYIWLTDTGSLQLIEDVCRGNENNFQYWATLVLRATLVLNDAADGEE